MAIRNATLVLVALVGSVAPAEPLVIAHRGACGYLPEHSLEAKALAHGQHAAFIEQDVVLTQDDVPVVLHDVYLDAVCDVAERFPDRQRTDGRFYVLDFTLAELRTLRFWERRDPETGRQIHRGRFPTGIGTFRISTLAEELDFLKGLDRSTGRRTGVYTEIKEPSLHCKAGHDISPLVLAELRRHGFATKDDACFLQCFDVEEVRRLRRQLGWQGRLVQLLGEAPAGAEDPLLAAGGLAALATTVDCIGPPLSRVVGTDGRPTGLVAAAHREGLLVHAYTFRCDQLPAFAADTDAALRILFVDAGIDGLFSDFPDVCVRWLRDTRR